MLLICRSSTKLYDKQKELNFDHWELFFALKREKVIVCPSILLSMFSWFISCIPGPGVEQGTGVWVSRLGEGGLCEFSSVVPKHRINSQTFHCVAL